MQNQITDNALKRIGKDIKELQQNPLPGANAVPNEDNIFLWHGNITISLNINNQVQDAPLHFLIELRHDYPMSAPSVGFCTEFPFYDGATRTQPEGNLKGLYVLCLNILGNFDFVHTEWKNEVGQGWSSSMSISTLLIYLQNILMELDQKMQQNEKIELINKLLEFSCDIGDKNIHKGTNPYPKCISFKEFEDQNKYKRNQENFVDKLGRHNLEKVDNLANELSLSYDQKRKLYDLILDIQNGQLGEVDEEQNKKLQLLKDQEKIKKQIFCYVSGTNFEEDVLGFGIYQDKNLISSFADLLSYSQFYDHKVRNSSNKQQFEYFIPAFINETHSKHKQWEESLKNGMFQISYKLGSEQNQSLNDQTLLVLPKLINSMVVEMKKNDKAQAIQFFEGLCSFWRTLYYCQQKGASLKKQSINSVKNFVSDEHNRHKDYVPDIGITLAIYTTVTDCIELSQFIDAYLDENFIRQVMWWNTEYKKYNSQTVFELTKVSRELLIFQLLLIRFVIGSDPHETCKLMDQTYGKMPQKLEEFQKILKETKINNWKQFLDASGCSEKYKQNILNDEQKFVDDCIKRSQQKGSKYVKFQKPRNRY